MSARYVLRLDDACDTMDRGKWELLEAVCERHALRPIVAIVADNRDPELMIQPRDGLFWERVRNWQSKGWTVAMHGHTHEMHATLRPHLVPFYKRSEFVGLDLEAQRVKIRAAWGRFLAEGVTPRVWVAPAHSFELVTLQALRAETTINVVSDGIAFAPYFEHGFYWIPQQLWELKARHTGLWTVCLHPNVMSEDAIAALDSTLGTGFRKQFVSAEDVELNGQPRSALDRLYNEYFWWRWRRATGSRVPQAS